MCEIARRTPCASLLLAGAAAVLFLAPGLTARFQYDREAIAAGEVWRLVTGHWTHYSFDHFIWDAIAFGALAAVSERRSRVHFLTCVVTSAVAICGAVWLMYPEMRVYRGLSGIDSALFTFVVAGMWTDGRRAARSAPQALAVVCLAGFLLKVSFELMTGRTVFVGEMNPLAVSVPLAHIVGAFCGLLVGAGSQVVLRSSHTHTWNSSTA